MRHLFRLMRLDRPIGIFLLLWPTLQALWLANAGWPGFRLFLVFVVGTVLMRSVGCVANDFLDQGFDAHVWRTQGRPLVTGEVSNWQALGLLGVLLSLSACLLFLLNVYCFILALIGAGLAMIYPLAKRVIPIPQSVLGFAFAWGIPMAYAASLRPISSTGWLLFLATFCWIIAYDTYYAMADRDDDRKIGIYSSALWLEDWDHVFILSLQAVMLGLLITIGIINKLHLTYYFSLVIILCLFAYEYYLTRRREAPLCFAAFLHNHWVGLVLFLGIFFSFHNFWL